MHALLDIKSQISDEALVRGSDSSQKRRSVRSGAGKPWQPPEALTPDDILAVVDAAPTERDRLLLRVLWPTGARVLARHSLYNPWMCVGAA
jgi:integrase